MVLITTGITQREKLKLTEYGRCIQEMVNYALSLEDRKERQRCAYTIIDLMANMQSFTGNAEDFYQKLWNHWRSSPTTSSTSITP